jgi:hypothetical protein
MASIHTMMGDLDGTEKALAECVNVVETAKTSFNPKLDKNAMVWLWQDNLLRFYIHNKIDRAIDYATEIYEDPNTELSDHNKSALLFNLGTSYAL